MNLKAYKRSEFSSSPHLMLIGNPVRHSLSPLMHNTAADYYNLSLTYYAVKVEKKELSSLAVLLNNEQLKGANVTIPYKQTMIDYVDTLDEGCQEIGALNTIVKNENTLAGFNTDVYGFCKPLEPYASEIEEGRSIVFGSGGAARAVVFGLRTLGIREILIVSRNPEKIRNDNWPARVKIISYDAWPEYASGTRLFVNATPLGMEPRQAESPIKDSEKPLLQHAICYDLVYNPLRTVFLHQAEEANARTIGGLEMLIHQGSRSFELWTGKPFPIEIIRNTLKKELANSHAN